VTDLSPSRKIAWASTVAVVVPSPARSDVLVATSFTIWAPMFSIGSSSSISLATVTPSLVTVGLPNFLSMTTFRPFGPRVIFTASVSSIGRMATRSASGKIFSFVFAAVAVAMGLESSTSVPGSKCLWNNVVSTLIWRVLNNREESLLAAVACQGGDTWRPRAGEAASESTIARAWSSVVASETNRQPGNASPGHASAGNVSRYHPPRPHPAIQPIRPLRILRIQARQLHAPVRAVDELELAHVHPNVGHARPGTGRQKQ